MAIYFRKDMNFIKKTASSFTVQVAFFLALAYLFFGFSQVGYEGVFSQLMNGTFNAHQDHPIYGYICHFLTFRLYLWLGAHFPFVLWSSVMVVGMMVLSLLVFAHVFEKTVKLSTVQYLATAFVLVFFFIRNSFFILDLPSYAMLICSLSLLSLFLLDKKNKGHSVLRWLALFSYSFGLLTRIEAALPVTALMLLLHLLLYKNIRATVVKFAVCLVPFVLMAMALKIDFAYSDDYYKRLEPWAEPALSHPGGLLPLAKMKTEKDSMRYIAASQLIYDDTVQLNESFLRSIIAKSAVSKNGIEVLQKKNSFAFQNISVGSQELSSLFCASILYILLIAMILGIACKQLKTVVIYVLCMCLGLFLVATVSIDSRFIMLVLTFGMLQLLVGLLYSSGLDLFSKKSFNLVYLILTTISVYGAKEERNHLEKLEKRQQQQQFFYSSLQQRFQEKTLIFDLFVIDILYTPVFQSLDVSPFKAILLHDCVHEMHINHLRSYFEQQCHCNAYDWSSVYTYFYKNKESMVFISTPSRIALKQAFLQKGYGKSYSFQQLAGPIYIYDGDSIFCYQLKEIR